MSFPIDLRGVLAKNAKTMDVDRWSFGDDNRPKYSKRDHRYEWQSESIPIDKRQDANDWQKSTHVDGRGTSIGYNGWGFIDGMWQEAYTAREMGEYNDRNGCLDTLPLSIWGGGIFSATLYFLFMCISSGKRIVTTIGIKIRSSLAQRAPKVGSIAREETPINQRSLTISGMRDKRLAEVSILISANTWRMGRRYLFLFTLVDFLRCVFFSF